MRFLPSFMTLLLVLSSSAVSALDQAKGSVLLTVSGAIDANETLEDVEFDMAMLSKLPQYTVTTQNPWAKGLHTYQGFSAADLVARLGSQANLLQVSALNRYMTEIPLSDFVENGAIFATHQDGRAMSVRNLGPIMVIYPFVDRNDLKSEVFYGRSIWQVNQIKLGIMPE